jgi:putative Holliday junction resolvase
MRFLGVDPGGKRLGLALGDDVTGLVTPLAVEPYGGLKTAARLIAGRAAEHGADLVVIGLPTNAEGLETPACARSHSLAAALDAVGVEVVLQPEYLTTSEARRRARTAGRRPSVPVDDLAAQVIVEEYLDTLRHLGECP